MKTYHYTKWNTMEDSKRNKGTEEPKKRKQWNGNSKSYLSIITLHVNRVNSLIKRHKEAKMNLKNKSQQYISYKRLTLALRTYIVWKWRDGEKYSMQMIIKRKQKWLYCNK